MPQVPSEEMVPVGLGAGLTEVALMLTEVVVGLPITGSLFAARVTSIEVAEVARDMKVVMGTTMVVVLVQPATHPCPQYASVLPLPGCQTCAID